jgi:putative Mn2+ efflux pump MntP
MNIIEIIISSFALASDAFAVSLSKGIALNKIKIKNCLIVASWFSIFQGLMPTIGYILTNILNKFSFSYDYIISTIILLFLGIKMIHDTLNNKNEVNASLKFIEMLMFAIATSIDALSFGIAYKLAYNSHNAFICFITISIITFILSFIGVLLGTKLSNKYEKTSKIIGGIILILLSFNILLEHI